MYSYGITGTSINEVGDVVITGIADGEVLQYNATTGKWENVTVAAALPQPLDTTDSPTFNDLEVSGTLTVLGNNTNIHGLHIAATHNIQFEGATNNSHETTLTVVDPTADRTVTLPDKSGRVVLDTDTTVIMPVNNGIHYSLEGLNGASSAPTFGGAHRVRIGQACSITEVGLSLAGTYGGATTQTYRIGIYRDNGSNYPGTLAVDAGTLSIATGATAGFKNIVLGTPVTVDADEWIWLVVAAAGNSGPSLFTKVGSISPYRDNGAVNGFPLGVGYTYVTGSGTALPDPFGAGAGVVAGGMPIVMFKTTV